MHNFIIKINNSYINSYNIEVTKIDSYVFNYYYIWIIKPNLFQYIYKNGSVYIDEIINNYCKKD